MSARQTIALVITAAGGFSNCLHVVSNEQGWILQSRDLNLCDLQSVSTFVVASKAELRLRSQSTTAKGYYESAGLTYCYTGIRAAGIYVAIQYPT